MNPNQLKPNQNVPPEASKWLDVRVLLDGDEMSQLCDELPSFGIYATGSVMKQGQGFISLNHFLTVYRDYVACLKSGKIPNEAHYRQPFSSLWTRQVDHLAITQISESEQLIRPCLPVIQLSHHRLSYSPVDGKFRSMVLGNSLTWGIQFAYPQIFKDAVTQDIVQVSDSLPNTELFRKLQRWVRHHTLPTPFIAEGRRINVPVRIGRRCMEWIHQHPQLLAQNLKIAIDSSNIHD